MVAVALRSVVGETGGDVEANRYLTAAAVALDSRRPAVRAATADLEDLVRARRVSQTEVVSSRSASRSEIVHDRVVQRLAARP